MKKILLLFVAFFLGCSNQITNNYFQKFNYVGIDYIFKKNKIKVIDERDKKTRDSQKFFKKEEINSISLENAISIFGDKTDYKYQLIIEKGDILNPKAIRIKNIK